MKNYFLTRRKLVLGVMASVVFVFTSASVASAYYQEIGAPASEVYAAVVEILGDEYVDEANLDELTIKSKWVLDRTVRTNKTLLIKTKKSFVRRTKYSIELKSWPSYTEVLVKTKTQFKPADAKSSTPWRSLKLQRAEKELGALFFRKVLAHMESKRKTASK